MARINRVSQDLFESRFSPCKYCDGDCSFYDILDRMNIDRSDYLEIPELEEEDAKCSFLHCVGHQW